MFGVECAMNYTDRFFERKRAWSAVSRRRRSYSMLTQRIKNDDGEIADAEGDGALLSMSYLLASSLGSPDVNALNVTAASIVVQLGTKFSLIIRHWNALASQRVDGDCIDACERKPGLLKSRRR
jgi:hypothetical protein